MFGRLVALVRADIDRQIAWLKAEFERQGRHVALTVVLAAAAALCALGAIVVGCTAFYWWLALRYGAAVAFAVLGGGLALLAFMLFVLAFARHRPKMHHPPVLQSVRPATLVNTVKQAGYADAIRAGEQVSKIANDHLRHGSRQSLFGTLALAALVGLIVGRRL
jgi:Putative Actinobacterial Holin-X, holin superfamily III